MPHFVDSNLLVYRHDRGEPEKQARAQQVLERVWQSRSGRVSTQVLSEFYVVATRKLATPIEAAVARDEVRHLEAWQPVALTPAVRERAWQLEDRYDLSWWDALIVAAAREAGCDYLLTEDLQDGQLLGTVRVVDPFTCDLSEIGL